MKNIFFRFTAIILISLIFNNCKNNNSMENISGSIEQIKNEFAPDKRVALFNIEAKNENKNVLLSGESNLKDAVENLVKKITEMGFTVKNEINILPQKELGENIFGIVNISVANIRSKPSHPAELATQSLLGTCVNVLKKEDSWYLIQTPDKYISWVDNDGIELVNEDEQNNWKQAEKVLITAQFTTARKEVDERSETVSDLVAGNILKLVKKIGNFTKVEFPDGRIGYVKNNHLTNYSNWKKSSVANENTILETASKFMGLPYLWGGTSTKAVDCSGFTKTVFFLNGVILPRDASQQVNVGELVDTKNNFEKLQKGDLLFFGRKKSETEKEKVTHVAIYLGNYKYIHAAGKVKINSFQKSADDFNRYRLDTFIRAKRIIGDYCSGNNLVKNNEFYN